MITTTAAAYDCSNLSADPILLLQSTTPILFSIDPCIALRETHPTSRDPADASILSIHTNYLPIHHLANRNHVQLQTPTSRVVRNTPLQWRSSRLTEPSSSIAQSFAADLDSMFGLSTGGQVRPESSASIELPQALIEK